MITQSETRRYACISRIASALDLNANVFLHVADVHCKKEKERERGMERQREKGRFEGEVVYDVRSAARETNCLFKKRRPPRNECDRSTNLPRKKI